MRQGQDLTAYIFRERVVLSHQPLVVGRDALAEGASAASERL